MKWGKHDLKCRNKIIAALLTVVVALSSMPSMAKAEKKAPVFISAIGLTRAFIILMNTMMNGSRGTLLNIITSLPCSP